MSGPWFRHHAGLLSHPRVYPLSPLAKLTFLSLLEKIAEDGTDGIVSTRILKLICHKVGAKPRHFRELLEAELCVEEEDKSIYLPSFLKHNPSAAQIAHKQQERAKAGQLGGRAKAARRLAIARDLPEQLLEERLAIAKQNSSRIRNDNDNEEERSDESTSLQNIPRAAREVVEGLDTDPRVFEILKIFALSVTANNVRLAQKRLVKYETALPNVDHLDAVLHCHQHAVNAGKVTKDWFARWDTWERNMLKSAPAASVNGSNGSAPAMAPPLHQPQPSDFPAKPTGIAAWDELVPYITMLSRERCLPQRQLRDDAYRRFALVGQQGDTLQIKPGPVGEAAMKSWSHVIRTVSSEYLNRELTVEWIA